MRRRPAPPIPDTDRLPFLEGLRGIAALYVVLGHICSMADPSLLAGRVSRAPEWLQTVSGVFAYGHLAVAAFIVLSGFCLQLSLFVAGDGSIHHVGRFFFRRARRILPAYYACLAISLVVAYLVTQRLPGMPFALYLPLTAENIASHVLLIHNLSPEWMYKVNGVLWSIAIEVQLYIFFPLLVLLKRRLGAWTALTLACLAAATLYLAVPNAPKLYPWYLALFAFGMMAAQLAYRPNLLRGPRASLALGITVLAAVACGFAVREKMPLYLCDALLAVAVCGLIYAGAVAPDRLVIRPFALRPVVALGAFSYSLYLMHHPIQQVVYLAMPKSVVGEAGTFWYLLFVAVPLILAGTWLFSLAFEKPFLSSRKVAAEPTGGRCLVPLSLPLRAYHERDPRIVRAVIHAEVAEREVVHRSA